MTSRAALEWMLSEFGSVHTNAILTRCISQPEALEAIVITKFNASDKRRQTLRIAVRVLSEEMNDIKGTK